MDCLAARRRFGLKHRSLRIWTGWAIWVSALVSMGWTYCAYVKTVTQGRGNFPMPSWVLIGPHQASKREFSHGASQIQAPAPRGASGNDAARFRDREASKWDDARDSSPTYTDGHTVVDKHLDHLHDGLAAFQRHNWSSTIQSLADSLPHLTNCSTLTSTALDEVDAGMYALARAYAATDKLDLARHWTDALYATDRMLMAEPAYHLCRRLRETGRNSLAFHYYLLATPLAQASMSAPPNPHIPAEPGLHEYLLDYEKSILWSYVGDIAERHARLHGLAFSMLLLERASLPQFIRESVFSNLQYYAPHLLGVIEALRAEKSTDDEWRYSTPTFLDNHTTLIRVVNYYVADDGSYHVSPSAGERVNTKLVQADTDEAFEVRLSPEFQGHATVDHLVHPEAYIQGLEDTRVVRDALHGDIIFTLSASEQYSDDGHVMNQVLGVLDLESKTHTIENVIHGPHPERHDKNWVLAGGIDHVVYDWHPAINIGAIDRTSATLDIHTTILSPRSFDGMRGSTNGVLYQDEWWFVTHAVIYRAGRMRKYLHRLVVLDGDLKALQRYSLPFTFEAGSDVEYCLGFKVDDAGLTFGYSVRDRSSKIMRVAWRNMGELF